MLDGTTESTETVPMPISQTPGLSSAGAPGQTVNHKLKSTCWMRSFWNVLQLSRAERSWQQNNEQTGHPRTPCQDHISRSKQCDTERALDDSSQALPDIARELTKGEPSPISLYDTGIVYLWHRVLEHVGKQQCRQGPSLTKSMRIRIDLLDMRLFPCLLPAYFTLVNGRAI